MELFGLSGIMNTCVKFNKNNTDHRLPLHIVYRWKRIRDLNAPFVIVLRSVQSLCSENYQLAPIIPEFDFYYHRLDLLKEPQKCRFLNQLISFDFGTIYLSPRAFARPFIRLTQGYAENLNDIRHLIAYLFDHTTVLMTDPGLTAIISTTTPSIRTSVALVERIGKFWMHRHHVSELSDFIVRRYVVTDNGVMLIYPGTLLSHTYEPTNRIWYKRALALPGRLIITGPYLDDAGVGYIYTLSRTIFEGNSSYTGGGIHSYEMNKISAVIGMDVTYRFLSFMLSSHGWLPECGEFLKQVNLNSSSDSTSSSIVFGEHQQQQHLERVINQSLDSLFGEIDDDSFSAFIKHSTMSAESNVNNSNDNHNNHSNPPLFPQHLIDQSKNHIQSRCLLINDQGYLIAHPNFYDTSIQGGGEGPLEQNHLSFQ
ncbi:unnamed protein product [Schistosoma turkestanicum]|nr:unnamed protein product [Schistosoma turkestanicum]